MKKDELLKNILKEMKENEGQIQYGLAYRDGAFYKPIPEGWKQYLHLDFPKQWEKVNEKTAVNVIKEHLGLNEFKDDYNGDVIRVLASDHDGNPNDRYYQGEIYKGFGIVKWLSAGRQAPFCIHLKTGRIIPDLTGGTNEKVVKRNIDLVKDLVNASMDYEEINRILGTHVEVDDDNGVRFITK